MKGQVLVISAIADGIVRGVETVTDTLAAPFGDQVIRLGVTGLSRAGKTVFITSLVANLMDRGRMPQLVAASSGGIRAACLQPQPDDTLPRFDFEKHLARLTSTDPGWPEGTRRISELRLSLRVQPTGFLAGLTGPRTVHLDIIDYPGEWLLDLGLLGKSFAQWSEDRLARLAVQPGGAAYSGAGGGNRRHGGAGRGAGAKAGRRVHPGAGTGARCRLFRLLAGPVPSARRSGRIAGADLRAAARGGRGRARSLWREFDRRFESYKRNVVKPFFRNHFSKIDRQIVLVDVLGAIHSGPRAVEDLRHAMADILAAFRPGKNDFLSRIWAGRRVERILFAATKADHLHHNQHPQLTAITQALLRDARDRADFAGARTAAMSIAALRTTVEDTIDHEGGRLDVVRGRLAETGKQAAFYPGQLPTDPAHLLSPAREGAEKWLDADYAIMKFAPAPLTLRSGDGPPHIRLDRAAEFLFGDRLT